MKLINTTTLELSEFYDSKIPEYAILSHTWGEEEVSYQDWCSKAFPNKAGYEKIYSFCRICREDGYNWAWVDTCCIDKSSSAELSEAINSMYRWYQGRTCYAYLVDVSKSDIRNYDKAFSSSRWFTRGWTLQELIAPGAVYFYDKDWFEIGARLEDSRIIEKITGIPQTVLVTPVSLNQYSVAQKMSWASKRETTRIEDVAYCLLGLFGVNMPLLYGEGDKAFIRLQEEIMKVSADHTLFAWAATDVSLLNGSQGMDCGLLAPSPRYFIESNRFIRKENRFGLSSKPYSMTNRGLEIEVPLCRPTVAADVSQLAILNCASLDLPSQNIAVRLELLNNKNLYSHNRAMTPEGSFVRTECHKLHFVERFKMTSNPRKIYIQRDGAMFYQLLD